MDMSALPTDQLAAIIAQASQELARRAGGQQAAAPAQMALLDGFEPIDPEAVDLEDRLSDNSRRYRTPKEVAYILKRSEDAIVDRIKAHHIGFKRRGRYFVDMTRVKGPI